MSGPPLSALNVLHGARAAGALLAGDREAALDALARASTRYVAGFCAGLRSSSRGCCCALPSGWRARACFATGADGRADLCPLTSLVLRASLSCALASGAAQAGSSLRESVPAVPCRGGHPPDFTIGTLCSELGPGV